MKRQVRYRTREAIVKRIDRYHDKLEKSADEIMKFQQQISDVMLTGTSIGSGTIIDGEWKVRILIDRRDRLLRRIERINRRMARLKVNLAEFMTPQLPFIDNGDRSVAA